MPHIALRLRATWISAAAGTLLVPTLLFAFYLSVCPRLHSRLHSGAAQTEHTCAATLIASGKVDHTSPAPIGIGSASVFEFSAAVPLAPRAVRSLFLSARIFEHAPPASS
jgi:hypothetical protein